MDAEALTAEFRERGVYFYHPAPDLYHLSTCLADGFEELRIPVYSNRQQYTHDPFNRWHARQREIDPATTAIIIADLDATDGGYDPKLTYEAIRPIKTRRAVLCMSDGVTGVFNPFRADAEIPTFITSDNKNIAMPGRRIPWAFGLNREILERVNLALSRNSPRSQSFVRDFRPTIGQSVRQALDLSFVKLLEREFSIDRTVDGPGRFIDSHFERLAGSIGCLAYGGDFIEDYSSHPVYAARISRGELTMAGFSSAGPYVIRWDSWRFWESLAVGCVTVALDLEHYGFNLPVMPQNGVHYVGIRLDRLGGAIDFLVANRSRLHEIGQAGRAWAIEHYSPRATAQRFIENIARM